VGGLADNGSIKTDDGVVTFTHEGGRQTLLDGATGKILRTVEPDTKSPPQQ
jgi:hypothetical protein